VVTLKHNNNVAPLSIVLLEKNADKLNVF
jgi:hypothetical protein